MSTITHWPANTFAQMDNEIHTGQHRMHESALFTRAAIAALIDNHPPEEIHIHSMLGDSAEPVYMDIETGGLDGEAIMRAIERGCIWLSLVNLGSYSSPLEELIDGLYAELATRTQGFSPQGQLGNLLISSPRAEVFFHADAYQSLLWHLHGRKRVIVYPPWSERFLSRDDRESCLAGVLEDGRYTPDFDADAVVVDMGPGDFVSWPQTTPHRVINQEGLNISLHTEHSSTVARRRRDVAAANVYFRKKFGVPCKGLGITGPAAITKRYSLKAMNGAARLFGTTLDLPKDPPVTIEYRLDPNDERGFTEI